VGTCESPIAGKDVSTVTGWTAGSVRVSSIEAGTTMAMAATTAVAATAARTARGARRARVPAWVRIVPVSVCMSTPPRFAMASRRGIEPRTGAGARNRCPTTWMTGVARTSDAAIEG
jgi:hypothetical protein